MLSVLTGKNLGLKEIRKCFPSMRGKVHRGDGFKRLAIPGGMSAYFLNKNIVLFKVGKGHDSLSSPIGQIKALSIGEKHTQWTAHFRAHQSAVHAQLSLTKGLNGRLTINNIPAWSQVVETYYNTISTLVAPTTHLRSWFEGIRLSKQRNGSTLTVNIPAQKLSILSETLNIAKAMVCVDPRAQELPFKCKRIGAEEVSRHMLQLRKTPQKRAAIQNLFSTPSPLKIRSRY